MTRNLLEDYPHICAKITELETREGRVVSDTVSASSPGHPYTQHPVKIKGVIHLTPMEEAKLEHLRDKKKAVEEWLDSLPDGKERLARSVIKYGTKWNMVRRALKSNKSPDALRVEYNRIFKNF